jgi:hypothetical protein
MGTRTGEIYSLDCSGVDCIENGRRESWVRLLKGIRYENAMLLLTNGFWSVKDALGSASRRWIDGGKSNLAVYSTTYAPVNCSNSFAYRHSGKENDNNGKLIPSLSVSESALSRYQRVSFLTFVPYLQPLQGCFNLILTCRNTVDLLLFFVAVLRILGVPELPMPPASSDLSM